MRLLLDTHILIWTANPSYPGADRLDPAARSLIADGDNQAVFSVVSVWEVAIKFALGRGGFNLDPAVLRAALLEAGYDELEVTGEHAVAVAGLAPIHRDPFDRILIAQAQVEGLTLLTADVVVARYPGPIRLV